MIEFVLALILFGVAGVAMHELPFWRMALVVLLITAGQILLRASGVV